MTNTNNNPQDSNNNVSASTEAPANPPAEPVAPTASGTAAAPTAPAAGRGGKRGLLIGGAIAAGLLVLAAGAGIGAAVANISDNDDDRPGQGELDRSGQGSPGGAQRDERDDDRRGDDDPDRDDRPGAGAGQAPVPGVASAAELVDIIETASAAADGSAVNAEVSRDGSWEVQLVSASAETEVRVANGVATVVSSEAVDADDLAPTGELDQEAIDAIVTAALAEAAGTITEVEVESDTVSPYGVTVLTTDRGHVSFDLGPDFAVVATENEGRFS